MILGQLCFETMRLEYITKVIQPLTLKGPETCEIEGVAYDSRQVRPGFLFVALPGRHVEGADFIGDAVQRGAVAVVSENPEGSRRDVTHICVEDARLALAEIACAFYGEPSSKLKMVGITGTNGKSTTSFMMRDVFKAAGLAPGLIGTIQYEIGERMIPATRTTPEAPDIQSMLDKMVRGGCKSAVMEVSSHGLDQKRVWGIDFDVGVFTNLTQDHLDYHRTMESYFAAKTLLFSSLGQLEKKASAVINIDDRWGMELANINGSRAQLVTYGLHPSAMVRAENVELSPVGSAFDVTTPWGATPVHLNLLGRFNVFNALSAIAACGTQGIPPATAARVVGEMVSVPGRLERIPNQRGLHIYVDYAHTDDALLNVLQTLREIAKKKVLLVFGCGGDRDQAKRSKMGAVAARYADHSIITSDNPRTEDPAKIVEMIREGFGDATHYEIELDREKAIAQALSRARAGDTVLIAGKGHENYQEFANTVIPFDDREVVRDLLKKTLAQG